MNREDSIMKFNSLFITICNILKLQHRDEHAYNSWMVSFSDFDRMFDIIQEQNRIYEEEKDEECLT